MATQNIIRLMMRITPMTSILFILMMSYMPFFPIHHALTPNLIPVMVLFWAIYLPQFCPILFVFACGLFIDIMSNSILGLNSFLLIIIYFIAVRLQAILQAIPISFQILIAFIPITLIFMMELLYIFIALTYQHQGWFLMTKYIITLSASIPLWLLLNYMFYRFKSE